MALVVASFARGMQLIRGLFQSASENDTTTAGNAGPRVPKNRLLFMGLKRSGKSSIINVVLFKMAPNDTLWIQATTAIKKYALQTYRNYPIWDLPGQIDFLDSNFDTDSIFNAAGCIVWVIDAQDEYQDSITRLVETYAQLQPSYPDLKYAVFVHKVDSLSPEGRDENYGDIVQRVQDDLEDAGVENPAINFYATSVYDHSVADALSTVMQTLNPHLATFETLLQTLATACRFEKLYLVDIATKLYIASDTFPADPAGYQLCSDYIGMILDLNAIYDWDRGPQPAEEDASGSGQGNTVQSVESFMGGIAGGYSILLKEMNKSLALIGYSKEPRFAQEKPMVDFNVHIFEQALSQVLARI